MKYDSKVWKGAGSRRCARRRSWTSARDVGSLSVDRNQLRPTPGARGSFNLDWGCLGTLRRTLVISDADRGAGGDATL